MTSSIPKGQTIPCDVSQDGFRRVQIGALWDIREIEVEKGLIVKSKEQFNQGYDVDIFCLIFDQDKDFIDIVSPNGTQMMDESGSISHSGDNQTGRGENDDEFISVHLRDVPEHIAHIVFVINTNDQHVFSDVLNLQGRISDGKTGNDMLLTDVNGTEAADSTAFIFARLFRKEGSSDDWMVHHIHEYGVYEQIEDWEATLQQYLT